MYEPNRKAKIQRDVHLNPPVEGEPFELEDDQLNPVQNDDDQSLTNHTHPETRE
jgi:hypothetical protein